MNGLTRLTGRERSVLQYTAQGYTSNEIAVKLSISPKTVDTYRARVMQKLGMTHRYELVSLALDSGLLGRHAPV
jgi:two-component system, NarL family, response regulator NreC